MPTSLRQAHTLERLYAALRDAEADIVFYRRQLWYLSWFSQPAEVARMNEGLAEAEARRQAVLDDYRFHRALWEGGSE